MSSQTRKRLSTSPAKEINRLHAELLDISKTTIKKAIRIGELLTRHKAKLKGRRVAAMGDREG